MLDVSAFLVIVEPVPSKHAVEDEDFAFKQIHDLLFLAGRLGSHGSGSCSSSSSFPHFLFAYCR
jgi:hypothetical protein